MAATPRRGCLAGSWWARGGLAGLVVYGCAAPGDFPATGRSGSRVPAVFASGTPAPLGIGSVKPRAFSDAYTRGVAALAARGKEYFDTANFQFTGVDRSKIDADGLASASSGQWCLFFYSPTSRKEVTVLLTYPASGDPEIQVNPGTGSPDASTQIDPAAIKVDSDEAARKRSKVKLKAENNVRLQMDEGLDKNPRPAYIFLDSRGVGYAVDARTGTTP